MITSLPEAIRSRPFSIMVELVASAHKSEAQVLEIASNLATVPDVVAGSITSYAGGKVGQDPVRVSSAVRARGLTPNVHLTCVQRDRQMMRETLATLRALEIYNVFALTGDWPAGSDTPPVFDLESVQLTELIASLRAEKGIPFHISVAVSPFKYQREDCLYQYLKLEKKVAAGANLAITQVGWDSRKFAELRRYVDERGLDIPLMGNVYVLSRRAAERMATGSPPGCWAPPSLVEATRKESADADGGLGARLERAAQQVAVLKGLGYAGAYVGGTHSAEQITRILNRAKELEPQWQECAAKVQFGDPNGFYLDNPAPPKPQRTMLPVVLDIAGKTMPMPWSKNVGDTAGRRAMRAFFAWVDRHRTVYRLFERFEYYGKRAVFGCEECGNCVLGSMEYVCPQTCPKQMRNGPCGGTFMGRCEVVDQQCIWVSVYQRADAAGRVAELKTFIPPPDRKLLNTASWVNYFLNRDSRPGHPKPVDASTAPLVPARIVHDVRKTAPAPAPAPAASAAQPAPEREKTHA
jgi:methylenetetrahydrofolate reductase (NADPH)